MSVKDETLSDMQKDFESKDDNVEKKTSKETKNLDGYITEKGLLYYKDLDKEDKILVCSQLDITARTRDEKSLNHGRLLEFQDADGISHCWSMPMELLATDGAEYRRILLSMGVNIPAGRKARELLTNYLQSSKPEKTALCTDSVGWHGDIFVFPEETFGESETQVYLQSTSGFLEGFDTAGTLNEWQKNIGKLCEGNSRLILAVSIAFAAPLLHLLGEENGGFHFRGASSSGKTTALKVACSVWGGKERLQRWRATSNGLEGTAKLHNDGLLCLDELAQVDPKEAGEVAYMLANGAGKIRSKRDGTVKPKTSWRLLFLSAGEIGLADHMQTIGKRVRAGQEVRLIDIESDSGSDFGLFEELHGFENGDVFSRNLIQSSGKYYGAPIREFLTQIVKNKNGICELLRKLIDDFIKEVVPLKADGQVQRGAIRFAIVAAAGTLATQFGITGWKYNSAIEAAKKCFDSWINSRGGHVAKEETEAQQQVRKFFQLHSESRFTKWEDYKKEEYNKFDRPTINRAGFKKITNKSVEFFVETEVFKTEICEGLDFRFVVKVCKESGWLLPDTNGKSTTSARLPDSDKTRRVYHFNNLVLGDDNEE